MVFQSWFYDKMFEMYLQKSLNVINWAKLNKFGKFGNHKTPLGKLAGAGWDQDLRDSARGTFNPSETNLQVSRQPGHQADWFVAVLCQPKVIHYV